MIKFLQKILSKNRRKDSVERLQEHLRDMQRNIGELPSHDELEAFYNSFRAANELLRLGEADIQLEVDRCRGERARIVQFYDDKIRELERLKWRVERSVNNG